MEVIILHVKNEITELFIIIQLAKKWLIVLIIKWRSGTPEHIFNFGWGGREGGVWKRAPEARFFRDPVWGHAPPEKFEILEARNWYCQHSPWDIPFKKSTWIKCKITGSFTAYSNNILEVLWTWYIFLGLPWHNPALVNWPAFLHKFPVTCGKEAHTGKMLNM